MRTRNVVITQALYMACIRHFWAVSQKSTFTHMRAALYARVSTKDKGQDTENQILQLREACERWGYEIVDIYEDQESGGKGRKGRGEFDRMFRDAEKGRFDIVVFWALDRFSRQGIQMTLDYLRILESQGVGFRSLKEPMLNTDDQLVRHILLTVISYFAKMESERRSDRVKAGMARSDKKAGRPSKANMGDKIRILRAEGMSWRDVAKELNMSVTTARKYAGGT